jgi:hypothetical protein
MHGGSARDQAAALVMRSYAVCHMHVLLAVRPSAACNWAGPQLGMPGHGCQMGLFVAKLQTA